MNDAAADEPMTRGPQRLADDAEWHSYGPDLPFWAGFVHRLFGPYAGPLLESEHRLAISVRRNPCHAGGLILRLCVDDGRSVFALMLNDFTQPVHGREGDLYALNLRCRPELGAPGAAAAYLQLFLDVSRGGNGWYLAETPADLRWEDAETSPADRAAAEALLHPIVIGEPDAQGLRPCRAIVQREGRLVERSLVLWPDGLVIAREDRVLLEVPRLAAPPPLRPFQSLFEAELAGIAPRDEAPEEEMGEADAEDERGGDSAASSDTPAGPSARTLTEVFRLMADILLQDAIRASFRPRGKSAPPEKAFAEYLRVFRPTVAIETPYGELRQDFAEIIAKMAALPLNRALQAGPAPARLAPNGAEPCVALLTEASFTTTTDGTPADTAFALDPIVHGPHIGLFVVARVPSLDQTARDMIDLRLSLGRLSAEQFWKITRALFGAKRRPRDGKREWIRYLLPRDIARAAAATREIGPFLAELEETVTRRLAQYTEASGPSLAELHGMGEARYRMEELAADIAAAQRGEIGWDQIDRGYLLVGPPGTGKTTLVRALARACGIRFVLASASAWQEGGSLGPHIQNIRATFREARLYAPAVLFIDELDSIGRRGRIEAQNSQYQTVVINTLLEELQGFQGREGVIVIGATNNPEDIDPALRRPGRLDRTVELGYPNVAALTDIYGYYLGRAAREGFTAETLDVPRLARMTFGRTGAHVELYVRGAVRRARRAGRRALTEEDLQAEITNRPPDPLQQVLAPEAMRRVAVHEAGHALMLMAGPRGAAALTWVSITPRANGTLGFVAQMPDESVFSTHAELEESIRVILGGRAAEEMVFGRAAITTGAGGGEASDLAVASRLALRMLTQFGFSEASGLLWLDWRGDGQPRAMTAEAIRNLPLGDEILHETRRTLDRLYGETIERLRAHQAALMRIVDLLIARQDVPPEEVAAAMTAGG